MTVPSSDQVAERCASDGEFRQSSRFWTGGYRLQIGDDLTGVTITDGIPQAGVPEPGPGVFELRGGPEVWEPLLQAVPPRLANVVTILVGNGLELDADPLLWWQYLPATERLVELLRPPLDAPVEVDESGEAFRLGAPVGGYVYVPIDGHEYRIYFESAGSGIPVLLQHTAGAHSVQYRHLFECREITDRFRLIAYDLPYHGKSIPPVTAPWWEQEYRLTGDFLRQVPVSLAQALQLDGPVFMGCSVGGLLALDLSFHHPDVFRAVISLEGALRVGGDTSQLDGFFHPQVSNMSKARMMEGLCAPTSPLPYIKEVSQTYAAGWPPVFIGDLNYYINDYDLRERAGEIDTSQCEVHILNGDYDYSGTVERGLEAHRAIAGSTHVTMEGMGHFPMAENPAGFIPHLLPILEGIAERSMMRADQPAVDATDQGAAHAI
ncbi:MAG: alpha/beta hydrolase [Actinomycetota bacterium]